MRRLTSAILILTAQVIGLDPCHAAELPVEETRHATLRTYLQELRAEDLEVEIGPLRVQPSWLPDAESLHRFWVLLQEGARSLPPIDGLRIDAPAFTLASIESDDGIRLDVAQVEPAALAWWATWDYPGNPYYGNRPVKLRALVAAIVDLLMLDAAHARGALKRSDHLGGNLIRLAYVFLRLRDTLPPSVRAAYELSLQHQLEKLEAWGPTGIHADMDMFALVALAYLQQAFDQDALRARCEQHARVILAKHFREAGYVDHGGGYDPSYNGISLYFLTWAALVSDWEFVRVAHEKLCRLKGYTALPGPDRSRLYGPTHFATTMSMSAARDQWARRHREIGSAMLTDEALYTLSTIRHGRRRAWALPDVLSLRKDINRALYWLNQGLEKPATARMNKWGSAHWCRSINFAYDEYRPGFYAGLRSRIQQDPLLLRPPWLRSQAFIERFGDDFVVARFKRYGTIVHTGRLSWWKGLSGFGGGALSAFWTPQAGPLLLGRNRNRPYPKDQRDSWDSWPTWHTNALSGELASGARFSTARISRLDDVQASVDSEQGSVTLQITGTLARKSGSGIVADGASGSGTGSVAYERSLGIDESGIADGWTLRFPSGTAPRSMALILPAFAGHVEEGQEPPLALSVELELATGPRIPATDAWVDDVSSVHLRRGDSGMIVRLDRPRRVRLGARALPFGRNIQIDCMSDLETGAEGTICRVELRLEPWAASGDPGAR